MRSLLSLLFFLFIYSWCLAQESGKTLILVNFKDKGGLKLGNAEQYLSAKAIERRKNQKIALDESDLPVNRNYIKQVTELGGNVLCQSRWFNNAIFEIDQSTSEKLRQLPFVLQIKDLGAKGKQSLIIEKEEIIKFEKGDRLQGDKNTMRSANSNYYDYGSATTQITLMKGEFLHNHGYRGQGMTIAVIDAGFGNADVMPVFDSLRINNRIKGTFNFADPSQSVYDPNTSFHGTEVLSTMAANIPGDMVGTAPMADYWLLRSEVQQSESIIEEYYWVSAAEYADSVGADIINSSLGYTTFDDPTTNHTYPDMDGNTTYVTIGADKAAEKGILVVNSAGNSGGDFWQYIGAPADGDSVFTIGAVDASGVYAYFSSKGPTYDGRIKPTVAAMGYGTAVYTPFGLGYGSGTSFSSPIIAGMSACLWQADPSLANMQVIEAIKSTASQAASPDTLLGWGIPDFSAAFNVLGVGQAESTKLSDNLIIQPNPFYDNGFSISIQSDNLKEICMMDLLDLQGRVIKSRQISIESRQPLKIEDFSSISKGVYLLRLSNDHIEFVSKIIKF